MRALSTAWVVFMPPLLDGQAEEVLVGGERDEVDDHVRRARRIEARVDADGAHVGQPPASRSAARRSGEFGLAAAVVGQGEQVDHDAAGLLFGQPLQGGRRFVDRLGGGKS